jgi:hypothetical protein
MPISALPKKSSCDCLAPSYLPGHLNVKERGAHEYVASTFQAVGALDGDLADGLRLVRGHQLALVPT